MIQRELGAPVKHGMLRRKRFGSSTIALFATFALSAAVYSVPTNVTVDDDSPDPTSGETILYGPNASNVTWNTGQDCGECIAQPDPSQAFDGTWHDGTFRPGGPAYSATFSFTGTAIYVMSISVSAASIAHLATLSNSQQTFQINGTNMGTSSRTSTVGIETVYAYNTPIFVQEGLPLGRHNLTILNGGGSSNSLFLLDRIIYTSVRFVYSSISLANGGSKTRRADSPDSSNSLEPSNGETEALGSPSLNAGSPSSTMSDLQISQTVLPVGSQSARIPSTETSTPSPSQNSSASSVDHSTSSPTASTKDSHSNSRNVGSIVGAVLATVMAFVVVFCITWIWLRRRARSFAAALSSTPFEFVEGRLEAEDNDSSPPDYTSAVVVEEVTERASMDILQVHHTTFEQAGTKQRIAATVAAARHSP